MNRPASQRNGFLDVIRAIALVRVILWHAFASPALSWTITSMPTMFFVAGSLFAQGLDRRPARQLIPQRAKRLLIPFWVFSGAVLVLLALVHRTDGSAATALSLRQLASWIVPVVDPSGSLWEGGWLSTPLWYLRCYLWMLVLAAPMRAAYRRFGWLTLIPFLVAVVVVDVVVRSGSGPLFAVRWYVGDIAVYGVFVILGFAHHDGRLQQLARRDLLEWACIALVAGVLWTRLVDVPGNVVNNSYPLLLVVGFAWLCAFLAAAPALASLTQRRFTAPVVSFLGRRSLTIYLWHSAAIVAGYWVRARFFPTMARIAILPIVAVGVVVATIVAGWVEDQAAGRPAQWWPRRATRPTRVRVLSRHLGAAHLPRIAAGAVLGAAIVSFVVVPRAGSAATAASQPASAAGGLGLPPAPSAKPEVADFGPTSTAAPVVATATPTPSTEVTPAAAADPQTQARVQSAVQDWASAHEISGVELGVSLSDGSRVLTNVGSLVASGAQPVTSITKTMTAAIVLQLVSEGLIGLDDPLPALAAVPDSPFPGTVTIRQLLNHTAGVMPYADTAAWQAQQGVALTPESALALAATESLQWEPGTKGGYSGSGYLLLGLLIEQLTGQSYAEVLQQRIFDPAGMTSSELDARPSPGWIGFSAGGVMSTIDDLLGWGGALYRGGTILSPDMLATMLDVDNPFSAGLGAFAVCPCSRQNGAAVFASIGHQGGQATLQWSPADGLVIAAMFSESLWTDHLNQQDVADLLVSVRAAVAGR